MVPVQLPNLGIAARGEGKTDASCVEIFAAWDFPRRPPATLGMEKNSWCSDRDKGLPKRRIFNEVKD